MGLDQVLLALSNWKITSFFTADMMHISAIMIKIRKIFIKWMFLFHVV